MFRVQSRKTGSWLQSPYKDPKGIVVWPFGNDERDAHEFRTRKEAKDTLLSIQPDGLEGYKILGKKGM